MLISKVRSDVHWQTIKLTSFQYSTIVPTVQSWSEHSAVKAQTALIIKKQQQRNNSAKEDQYLRVHMNRVAVKLILYFIHTCRSAELVLCNTLLNHCNNQGQTNYAQIEHLSIMLLSVTLKIIALCSKLCLCHSIMLKDAGRILYKEKTTAKEGHSQTYKPSEPCIL